MLHNATLCVLRLNSYFNPKQPNQVVFVAGFLATVLKWFPNVGSVNKLIKEFSLELLQL